jgi:hypothetical protein
MPPRRDDEIDPAAAASRASQPRRPFRHRETGAVALRLLLGIEIDLVPAFGAPAGQHKMRPRGAAERRRTRLAFAAFPLHISRPMRALRAAGHIFAALCILQGILLVALAFLTNGFPHPEPPMLHGIGLLAVAGLIEYAVRKLG